MLGGHAEPPITTFVTHDILFTEATGHTFVLAADAGPVLQPGVEAVIGLHEFSGSTLGQGGGRFTSSMQMVSGSVYIDTGITDPALLRTTLMPRLAIHRPMMVSDSPPELPGAHAEYASAVSMKLPPAAV